MLNTSAAIAAKHISYDIIRSRQQNGPAPKNLSKADLHLFLHDLPQQIPNLGLLVRIGKGETDSVAIKLRDLLAFLEKELGIKDPQQKALALFSVCHQIFNGKKLPGSKGAGFNLISLDAQKDLIEPSTDMSVQSKFCAKFKLCKNQKSWKSLFKESENLLAANSMNLQNAYNTPKVPFDGSSPEAKPNIAINDQPGFVKLLIKEGIITPEAGNGFIKGMGLLGYGEGAAV